MMLGCIPLLAWLWLGGNIWFICGVQVKFYTQHGNWDLVGNNIPV